MSGALLVPPENAAGGDPGFPAPGDGTIEIHDLSRLTTGGPVRVTLTSVADDPVANDLDLVVPSGDGTG